MLTLLILLAFKFSLTSTQNGRDYYTAAVFEHARLGDPSKDTPKEIIRMNLHEYNIATLTAASRGADIIVFPEYGLTAAIHSRSGMRRFLEIIPNPEEGEWNPCIQRELFKDREILTNLSCLARENNIVVVANMGEFQPCDREKILCPENYKENVEETQSCYAKGDSHCPEDGGYHYNDNVVFDRKGKLLVRYHKIHLFDEPAFNVPKTPSHPKFRTDFGTFTTFICFDILFWDSVKAVRQPDVNNVAYTTWWYNELPGYSSTQMMEAWSLGNKVNLIGANINKLNTSSVGSGIFSGQYGPIKYVFNPDRQSKLVIAKVPMRPNVPVIEGDGEIFLIKGDKVKKVSGDGDRVPDRCSVKMLGLQKTIDDYRCAETNISQYTLKKIKANSGKVEACNNGMCCSLDYTTDSLKDTYYLAVFNGTFNAINRYFWCEEICQLIRCDSFDSQSCSTFPMKSKTIFSQIQLRANFSTSFIYPSLVQSGMRLFPATKWNFQKSLSASSATLTATDINKPLLAARLLGRCYNRDPPYKP